MALLQCPITLSPRTTAINLWPVYFRHHHCQCWAPLMPKVVVRSKCSVQRVAFWHQQQQEEPNCQLTKWLLELTHGHHLAQGLQCQEKEFIMQSYWTTWAFLVGSSKRLETLLPPVLCIKALFWRISPPSYLKDFFWRNFAQLYIKELFSEHFSDSTNYICEILTEA